MESETLIVIGDDCYLKESERIENFFVQWMIDAELKSDLEIYIEI